jgi:hypothetical protein
VNVDEDGNSVSWQATPEDFLFHHSTFIRVYKAKLADHLRVALLDAVANNVWRMKFA